MRTQKKQKKILEILRVFRTVFANKSTRNRRRKFYRKENEKKKYIAIRKNDKARFFSTSFLLRDRPTTKEIGKINFVGKLTFLRDTLKKKK